MCTDFEVLRGESTSDLTIRTGCSATQEGTSSLRHNIYKLYPGTLALGGRSLAVRVCAGTLGQTDLRVLVAAQPQAYQPQDQLSLLTEIKLHRDYIAGFWR